MKIVHLCLSCFYIDGYAYQENELVAQNVVDGHDVLVVASTETYGPNRELTYTEPGEYMGTDGARVIRLPYRKFLPHKLMRKLRAHPGVLALLKQEAPDVILFHGLCGWELLAAAEYKRENPATRLFVDSHEDANNSARSFLSRYGLHYSFYRPIIQRVLPAVEKVLCISVDTISFVRDFYGVPQGMIEFYPLGGKAFSDGEYAAQRAIVRDLHVVDDKQVLFVQSGKIDQAKKLLESLKAFSELKGEQYRYIIAGSLQSDIAVAAEELIARDPRVQFIGWQTPEELRGLLCAADVYVQPGSQSATMQMSICCRCVVILDDVPSHHPFMSGNGWLVGSESSLKEAFVKVGQSIENLPSMSENSAAVAAQLLDYKTLAARIY